MYAHPHVLLGGNALVIGRLRFCLNPSVLGLNRQKKDYHFWK